MKTTQAARPMSAATLEWGIAEPTVQDAIRDGLLLPIPPSASHGFALYLDADLAAALGLSCARYAGCAPDVLEARVRVLREAVARINEWHPLPEIHQAVPFAVNGRGEPSGLRFVAVIQQEGVVWLTSIRAQDPEPVKPEGVRVGDKPAMPTLWLVD
jgi:hypothetical protein